MILRKRASLDSAGSIHILEKQDTWVAVDKPCGISIHNDPGTDVISRLKTASELGHPTDIFPVHRLDKETSGVLILATEKQTAIKISEAFAQNRVKKKYIAMVHGTLPFSVDSNGYGSWTYTLTKKAEGRNNPQGKGKRVSCETRFKIMDQSDHYTLLEIDLITGRKHQIRRHAKLSGHPVIGDKRYGSKRAVQFLTRNFGFNRLGLHCRSMTLELPSGVNQMKQMTITSTNPCEEMNRLLRLDKQTYE